VRFSIELPTARVDEPSPFQTAPGLMACAAAIEAAGFDACWVPDHPAPASAWLTTEKGHHALDPMIGLTVAATATTHLKLQTHILVLPYRNPFVVAKLVASLDAISNGRVILGVAAGYVREEFETLGVDFDSRNVFMDEAIDVIKMVWTEDNVRVNGKCFTSSGTTSRPRPTQIPHPPIWIGGNSRMSMRRAVDRAQGWMPMQVSVEASKSLRTPELSKLTHLRSRMAELQEYQERSGRTGAIDVGMRPFSTGGDGSFDQAELLDEVRELEAVGIGWALVRAPLSPTDEEFCDEVARFGEEIIARHHDVSVVTPR
jgi:probable F420-dependent oxidoreductase